MEASLNTVSPEKGNLKTIQFPRGLPGLESYREFAVEPIPGNEYFIMFRSVEDPDVGLIMTDPFPFFPDYSFELPEGDREELQINSREEVLVLTVVTVGEKVLYTNLTAPVVINPVLNRGKQVILPDKDDRMRVALAV